MDRKRVIDESIHSGEMEGAYVSAEFRKDADEYVRGGHPHRGAYAQDEAPLGARPGGKGAPCLTGSSIPHRPADGRAAKPRGSGDVGRAAQREGRARRDAHERVLGGSSPWSRRARSMA